MSNSGPPFRADHVGSLLRPQPLLAARAEHEQDWISRDTLRLVEDDCIRRAVEMQAELGLQGVTDAEVYRQEIAGLAAQGCTYLQLDDTSLAYLNDPAQRAYVDSIGGQGDTQHLTNIRLINQALQGKPAGMTVCTHMCRGNFRSSWVAEGGYDHVAEALFGELAVDGFFLEYDDARSGGFEPLRFVPKAKKRVVLGLVKTKRPALESKDDLKRRIDEAAKYVPLEQLCLSPHRRFSSTVDGNALTRDEQIAKLHLVVETAHEIWR